MKVLSLLYYDVKLQVRHGFYLVYFFVSILYIIFLRALPQVVSHPALPIFIFSDPAFFGFFIAGSFLMLEKMQGTLRNLFVTPLKLREYIAGRLMTLGILALLTSFLITLFVRGTGFHPFWLFLGVLSTSFLFNLLGLGVAASTRSISYFMMKGILVSMIVSLPLFRFFLPIPDALFALLPGYGSTVFIWEAFSISSSALERILALVNQAIYVILTWNFAIRSLHKNIILKIGEG